MRDRVVRLNLVVRGAVQGVGFRPFVYRLAGELGLAGQVRNASEGVVIDVEGESALVDQFRARLNVEGPPRASIQSLESRVLDPLGFTRFSIESSSGGAKTAVILPDIATCQECLADVMDPLNRRYRYPFTNCTNCGPRFSIIEALPYDRPNTTMRRFTMCERCRQEYEDPLNRRFHAQPNACPECGPRLELRTPKGECLEVGDLALEMAVAALLQGHILAVKGLGGFHLMADAADSQVVGLLRKRKNREEKPFAIMCPDANSLRSIVAVSAVEREILESPECPIVLLDRLEPGIDLVSDLVAPSNPTLGVMLPYTPLHHLLMSAVGRPLVATSGNLSEEPICTGDNDAFRRLGRIADLFLLHDRPIARHVDDSVARVVMGRPLLLRRARGYAPLPLPVDAAPDDTLALGGHLKNTVALSVGGNVFISQHIGDLETKAAELAFRRVIEDFQTMYEIKPGRIACDAHPDYVSSRLARSLSPQPVRVQHHYAHVLSCMAENELPPPVLGVSWDGTGYGSDGTVWGGEFLKVEEDGFSRFAHFRTFPLPGGEAAVREPRRSALGLLYEVFGEELWELSLPLLRDAFEPSELKPLRRMLERSLNCPRTSSVGRLFDGVAALTGLRARASFEGQAAMELEAQVQPSWLGDPYPLPVTAGVDEGEGALIRSLGEADDGSRTPSGFVASVVNWEPMLHAILEDCRRKARIGEIVAKFHSGLCSSMLRVAGLCGLERVVLSGGCFQNRRLLEGGVELLRGQGFQPYWHQLVPPNDGGLALGQLMAARRKG